MAQPAAGPGLPGDLYRCDRGQGFATARWSTGPFYVVIGVTVNGERDILGLWAGDGSEGAKFWLAVLTEIRNRGVEDVCIAVCDGLKGLPESITTTWQYAQVQACILHLIRNEMTSTVVGWWGWWGRQWGIVAGRGP